MTTRHTAGSPPPPSGGAFLRPLLPGEAEGRCALCGGGLGGSVRGPEAPVPPPSVRRDPEFLPHRPAGASLMWRELKSSLPPAHSAPEPLGRPGRFAQEVVVTIKQPKGTRSTPRANPPQLPGPRREPRSFTSATACKPPVRSSERPFCVLWQSAGPRNGPLLTVLKCAVWQHHARARCRGSFGPQVWRSTSVSSPK